MKYKYFSLEEFNCKCKCNQAKINPLLVVILDKIRSEIGAPVNVSSGIRCLQHNETVGGHPKSQHIPDKQGIAHAADITSSNLDELYELCQKHFLAIGDGRQKGFIHVDMRIGKVRRWHY